MTTKNVSGSCHCGNIKYTVDLPLAADGTLTASRCNCTFCQKPGLTNLQIPSPATFTLLSPASTSDPTLGDYNPNAKPAHKYFCRACGCHVWAEGEYQWGEQTIQFFTLNVASIDQPQEGVDVSRVKLGYWDGRNDNWGAGLSDAPCKGGLP